MCDAAFSILLVLPAFFKMEMALCVVPVENCYNHFV